MIPETTARAPEVFPNSWKLLEMLVKPTFSMICLWGIMEIVGFAYIANNFHDSRNYGSSPRGFPNSWKLLEMLVKPALSVICLWGNMEIVGFTACPTISLIPETMAPAPMGMVEHVGFTNSVHRYIFQDGVTETCDRADLTCSCEMFCKPVGYLHP